MNRWRLMVSANAMTMVFAASLLQWASPADAAAVTTDKEACDRTKARVAAQGHFSVSRIAFCDAIVPEAQPKGFYVLGLHGKRDECGGEICGSTLMGWFAVEKATGRVFEWDMAEWKLGRPVKVGP